MKIDLSDKFAQFGLTPKQAAIYVAIVELNSCTIGQLVKKTDLHKQTLYNEIEKLLASKYVEEKVINNRRHFSTSDPEIFFEKIKEKQAAADSIVPYLQTISGWEEGATEINIYEGDKAIFLFHQKKLKKHHPTLKYRS